MKWIGRGKDSSPAGGRAAQTEQAGSGRRGKSLRRLVSALLLLGLLAA